MEYGWLKEEKKVNKQLFTCYDISVPDTVLRATNNISIHNIKISSFPFMRWPNGRPCEAINMYLLDMKILVTGDTLKTYASELSHLVRYCFQNNIAFDSLTDSYIYDFSKELQNERSLRYPTERARNNNTVRKIISRSLLYLQWYQKNLLSPNSKRLIDEKRYSPNIVITIKSNPHKRQGNTYITHRAMPTSVSQEPKHPISQSIIENIELMVEKLSTLEEQSEKTLRKYQHDLDGYKSQLEYIRARRRFMIWLLKRTGLRPSEMVEINIADHYDILKTKRIIIPTKKRRKEIAPKRSFPITLKDSATFKRYLTVRERFLTHLEEKGIQVEQSLFLGSDGKSIKKGSLEKDFSRLVKACGYEDVQACFSMFRHRFITYEVIVHLKEFMSGSGKTRQIMTDADYRSILKRVSTKTGHGSEESLWHYIDLAWDELDVWGNIDKTLERLHAADRLYEELLELRYDALNSTHLSTQQVIDKVTDRLSEIVSYTNKSIKREE